MTTRAEDIRWRYNLAEVSQDKRTPRTAVRPGFCPEIVGADLRVQGGLRVFPGFKDVRRLLTSSASEATEKLWLDVGGTDTEQTAFSGFAVSDVFAVTIEVGANDAISGFVYRVQLDDDSWNVFFEFYDTLGVTSDGTPNTSSGSPAWRLVKLIEGLGATEAVAPMSVVVQSRLMYVMVEGREPLLYYVDLDDVDAPTSWDSVVVTDTGPGGKPFAPRVSLERNETFMRSGEYYLEEELSGSRDLNDPLAYADADILYPGTYDFAYQLEDSKTGRFSQLSELKTVLSTEFNASGIPISRPWFYDPMTMEITKGDPEFGTKAVRKAPVATTFDLDGAKWDRIHWYRTIRVASPGGEVSGGVLYKAAVKNISANGFTTANLANEDWLTDISLVSQDRYDNASVFLQEMPYAGIATMYRNTMFTSSVATVKEDVDSLTPPVAQLPSSESGLYALRYSSLVRGSLELFPPDNRYVPENPTDKIIGFQTVGDSLFGFSATKMYWVLKSGVSAVIRELHEGYGLVNKKAVTSSAGSAYACTYRGMVMVDQRGGLTGINVLDYLLLEEWAGSIESVRVVQDSRMGCLVVLNVSNGEAALMWERTRSVSELEHCDFVDVTEGKDPRGSDDRRALFVTSGGVVMRIDDAREKEDDSQNRRTSLFEVDGTINTTVDSASGNQIVLDTAVGEKWVGARAVIASGDRRGDSYTITGAAGVALSVEETVVGTLAGARIVVSPVVFKVTGWMLAQISQDGTSQGMDLFRGRYIGSVGPEFEGVAGPAAGSAHATYTARALKGLSEVELGSGQFDGVGVVDGSGNDWVKLAQFGVQGNIVFPQIEVVCGDLDFRLLGMSVEGNIEASDKTPR